MAGPPSRSSFPSVPGEPRARRLGVGSSGGGERPLRAQVIVALVCVTMLIAVPLYLVRKPSTKASGAAPSASASVSGGPQAVPKSSSEPAAAAVAPARVTLGPVQRVRCGSSAAAAPNEGALCDTLGPVEDALKKAILESEECAPKPRSKGSINYVLTVDFPGKKLHVYPGASGEWRGKQARRATTCVKQALKLADWNVPHQYRFYALAVLASYAGPPAGVGASSGPEGTVGLPAASASPGLPNFE